MSDFIGQSLERFEDQRFITGEGRFTDDLDAPGQAHIVMLRSPHAHAVIESVDVSVARAVAGVLAVYTGQDLLAAGIQPISSMTRTPPFQYLNGDGSEMIEASQPVLAADRVRFVGEPVAAVIAETAALAQTAAELIEVRYGALSAATTMEASQASDADVLWPELDGNRSCFWDEGDAEAVNSAFDAAAHVVEIETGFPRSFVTCMEPRGGVAEYDAATDNYLFRAGCQSAHRLQDNLAQVLNIAADRIRVVVPDVGGGFGARGVVYPEFAMALIAARDLQRPVRFVMARGESFLTDGHARGHRFKAALGLDQDGRFVAVRITSTWCHGAYFSPRSVYVLAIGMGKMVCGPYRIAAHHFALEGVFTNTAPTVSYRGISRAEPGYVLERLVEEAARVTGIDAVDLRRRNLIQPEEMPWTTPSGYVYGRAELPKVLDLGLEAADWPGFEARRQDAEARGRLLGRSLSVYIMSAGGVPDEYAQVKVGGNGGVTVLVGTQDFGMSHETAFAQVVADRLGVVPEAVALVQGDTDPIPRGAGGQGSRCLRIGGGAIVGAVDEVIAQGTKIAEDLLEAAASDIAYEAGLYGVAGTDRRVSLADVALAAEARGTPLAASDIFTTQSPSFPNGCHACEIEVDPQTGAFTIARFTSVVDPGRIINPMIVEGQMHGGVAQGIGEAAIERVVYDGSGQLLSGSLMDFALPRADDLPSFQTVFHPVPSEDNPLGVKGVGEAGTMVTPAVVMNAMLDALKPYGVTHLEMPLTSEAVWQAINGT